MNTVAPYNVLYFGCWNGPGHFLWLPRGIHASREVQDRLPWDNIDGALQPAIRGGPRGAYNIMQPEPQGKAALHRKKGWTCIAFWDRSADKRDGSNSNFFVRGTFAFEEMVRITKAHFPPIWDRFTFEVTCVDDNGFTVPDTLTLEEKAADYARVVTSLRLITEDRDRLRQKVEDLEADLRSSAPPPV